MKIKYPNTALGQRAGSKQPCEILLQHAHNCVYNKRKRAFAFLQKYNLSVKSRDTNNLYEERTDVIYLYGEQILNPISKL